MTNQIENHELWRKAIEKAAEETMHETLIKAAEKAVEEAIKEATKDDRGETKNEYLRLCFENKEINILRNQYPLFHEETECALSYSEIRKLIRSTITSGMFKNPEEVITHEIKLANLREKHFEHLNEIYKFFRREHPRKKHLEQENALTKWDELNTLIVQWLKLTAKR